MSDKRIAEYDLIKGVGIAMVVFQHSKMRLYYKHIKFSTLH